MAATMSVKDSIKIDIVSSLLFLVLLMRDLDNEILFDRRTGMGSRTLGSSSTDSGIATIWCGIVVGAVAGGPKSPCQWSSFIIWIIGGCFPNHRTLLEDIHWTRGNVFSNTSKAVTRKSDFDVYTQHFLCYLCRWRPETSSELKR